MSESAVILEVDDGVAHIILNRPTKYNAISLDLATEFSAAVASIAQRTDVGAILLRANGRSFCAGGDVAAMAEAPDRQAFLEVLARAIHVGLLQLAELPLATVVAVTGVVAGGGLGVMLAGDLVVAGEDATFASAYGGVGLTPDCGVSKNLPRWIGLQRAFQVTIGGRRLNAQEALDWGLVSEVVAVDAVATRSLELARSIAAGSPEALGRTSSLLRASWDRSLASSLDAEATSIVAASGSAESVALIEKFTRSRSK